MLVRALGLGAVASLVLGVFACGGAKPAAEAATAPVASSDPGATDGGAVAEDPYAAFDSGAMEQAAAQAAASGQANGPADACQTGAAAWEKRARPKIKACYREGKKKDPNLMGTARILIDVAFDGKPKPAKIDGISSLGDDVAKCMADAVTATPFPEASACSSRQLTIPVEFPTPR